MNTETQGSQRVEIIKKETKKGMTNEPSPRPWTLFVHDEQEGGDGEVSICAEGEWIATMNMRRSTAKDDAALIVAAVNERDRLRDLVRRLSRHLANYITSESENDLLREARAAIGEDKP